MMQSAPSCKIASTRVQVWKFTDVVIKKKLSLTQSANQRRALSGRETGESTRSGYPR
jgi:hypothetical protein